MSDGSEISAVQHWARIEELDRRRQELEIRIEKCHTSLAALAAQLKSVPPTSASESTMEQKPVTTAVGILTFSCPHIPATFSDVGEPLTFVYELRVSAIVARDVAGYEHVNSACMMVEPVEFKLWHQEGREMAARFLKEAGVVIDEFATSPELVDPRTRIVRPAPMFHKLLLRQETTLPYEAIQRYSIVRATPYDDNAARQKFLRQRAEVLSGLKNMEVTP